MNRIACLTTALIIGIAAVAQADYYVARNGANTHTYPFTDWATAASNIQDAVNAAGDGSNVWVEAGTYTAPTSAVPYLGTTNVVYIDKPLILRGKSGDPADVIINGQGTHRGVAWIHIPSALSEPFILDAVTVSNCFATNRGGGILLLDGTWTGRVQNCMIVDNIVTNTPTREDGGGGLFTQGSVIYRISNCTFRANTCYQNLLTGGGGGAYLQSSQGGRIDNCIIEDNQVYNGAGGGLKYFGTGSYPHEIHNSIIRRNRQWPVGNGERGGGGVQNSYRAKLEIYNSLVYNNRADSTGGGLYLMKGESLKVYNCTVVSNTAPYCGGIEARDDTDVVLVYNTIIYSNADSQARLGSEAVGSFFHCCIQTNDIDSWGAGTHVYTFDDGTVTNEPAFVDFANQNFHLTIDSPCLNAGTNMPWMDTALDLDGNRRVEQTYNQVDIGAYERVFHGTAVIVQ